MAMMTTPTSQTRYWPGYFEGPPAPPKGVRELKAEPEKIKKALKEELRRRTVRIKSILP